MAGGLIIILALYFVPTIVAVARHHHNALAIGMLNVFLGWTFIGWVVAIVWACTSVQKTQVQPMQPYEQVQPVGPSALPPTPARFDTATGRPIIGYDPQTGAPILGERPQPES